MAFGVTVADSDPTLPQTILEISEAGEDGKEMTQELKSAERTPPSEEDSPSLRPLTGGSRKLEATCTSVGKPRR